MEDNVKFIDLYDGFFQGIILPSNTPLGKFKYAESYASPQAIHFITTVSKNKITNTKHHVKAVEHVEYQNKNLLDTMYNNMRSTISPIKFEYIESTEEFDQNMKKVPFTRTIYRSDDGQTIIRIENPNRLDVFLNVSKNMFEIPIEYENLTDEQIDEELSNIDRRINQLFIKLDNNNQGNRENLPTKFTKSMRQKKYSPSKQQFSQFKSMKTKAYNSLNKRL